jgi:hypothetical protein
VNWSSEFFLQAFDDFPARQSIAAVVLRRSTCIAGRLNVGPERTADI